MQFLPFNTLYQLTADLGTPRMAAARTMAMIPDLIGGWLSGVIATEETNASTTGLVDPRTRTWAIGLVDELGLPRSILVHAAPGRRPRSPARAGGRGHRDRAAIDRAGVARRVA